MANILTVDDQLVIRRLLSTTLSSAKHEVHSCEDGMSAITFARKNKVDLVITDLNMPNISGDSLVRKLRSLEAYQNTPILVLTTESSEEKKQKLRDLGADGWIQKPFNPERLMKAVDRMLDKFGIK